MATRRLSRDRFKQMLRDRWKADQHVSLIGPTGRGKTYAARQMLAQRPGRILILAPKGADKTLANFGHQIKKWPPGPFVPRPQNGQWILRLEPPIRTEKDLPAQREYFRRALDSVFKAGDWTVYIDELQVLADPRMMGLGKPTERNLILGRGRNLSTVSAIQVPRWAPKAAYDQASHVMLWRQRDKPALKRIDEISGVDTGEVQALVRSLDFHEFVWVDAVNDEYYRVGAR